MNVLVPYHSRRCISDPMLAIETRLTKVAMNLKRENSHMVVGMKIEKMDCFTAFVNIGPLRGVLYDNYWIYLLLN